MKPINNNLIAKEWYDILISSLEIFSTPENVTVEEFEYSMKYREWTAVALDNLLKLEDSFFIEKN